MDFVPLWGVGEYYYFLNDLQRANWMIKGFFCCKLIKVRKKVEGVKSLKSIESFWSKSIDISRKQNFIAKV